MTKYDELKQNIRRLLRDYGIIAEKVAYYPAPNKLRIGIYCSNAEWYIGKDEEIAVHNWEALCKAINKPFDSSPFDFTNEIKEFLVELVELEYPGVTICSQVINQHAVSDEDIEPTYVWYITFNALINVR